MDQYDKIIFDFDDTIWSRDSRDINCSIYNAKFIKENLNDKAIIVSGNSFEHIYEKLSSIECVFENIWADANSTWFKNGVPSVIIPEARLSSIDFILNSLRNILIDIEPQIIGDVNIKLRPIESEDFRNFLVDELNYSVFPSLQLEDCIAKKTGKTTIDILSIYNSKTSVYNYLELDKYKTLYIGDEIDSGNDREIANMCTRKLQVSSVYETKAILDCFGRKI